jgi:tRNA modification GTPase
MNNRLSLADAEGVALGIEAETKEQLLALEDFRSGSLGQKVAGLLGVLEGLLVKIESQLDFSDEEDVVEVLSKEIKSSMGSSCDLLSQLVHDYRPFEKEAIKKNIVLVGKPNVGKSSLFNALVDEKVAIVSEVAGTTRDVVRKSVVMAGFAVEIQDTAGLNKNTSDPIEKEGMLLTERAEKNADLVLRVVDDMTELKAIYNNEECLVVLNKCDLLHGFSAEGVFCVSAKTGQGVAGLVEKIGEFSALSAPEKLVSSRIYNRLVSVSALLSTPLQNDDLFEFSAQLIRDSLVELKEIYGGFDNEKILDQIFENFCIGK